jgi:hypothetical protein
MPISAAGGATTTSVTYTSSTVQAWTTNGAQGPQGNAGTAGMQSATINVYQWAASIPAGPVGTSTYTWNGGAIGTIPSGWSATPGTSASQGMTLWAARVYLTDTATNTQTSFNWTTAAVIAVGYSGSNGAAAAAGASYVAAYCASSTPTTTTAPAQTTGKTSLPATNDGGIVGTWSSTVPTLTSGQYMYQSDGIYDPTTNKITWSIPYWSSLKVGTLSAITTNTGNLNVSGTISSANGKFSVDVNGNVIMQSASMQDGNGNVILAVGQQLADSYAPNINADKLKVVIGGDNLLNNSSFETQNLPTDYRPIGYTAYNNAAISTSFLNVTGRTGGKAFGIRADATGATTWGLYTGTELETGGVQGGWQPNKTYVVSFKAKKVNGSGFSLPTLQWNSAPSSTVWVARPALSTAWQIYTVRLTWGGTVEGQGRLYIDCNNGTVAVNDEFHIDELIIQEGDVYSEWFQSSREAKVTADAAITQLSNISSDNILSRGEKAQVILNWNTVDAEWTTLIAQADGLGVSRTAYNTAHQNLSTYLLSLSPAWNDTTQDTVIVGSTWRSNWTTYYDEKQKLINALAAKAATMATGVTLGSDGTLNGAGGGRVQYLPVVDGARTTNTSPAGYSVAHVKEFKQCSSIGLTTSATYCTLETIKPWTDNSGGYATQWAYVSSSEVWKRSGGCADTSWGAWIRDLDRSVYTGDLNATNGATLGPGGNVTGAATNANDIANNIGTFDSAKGAGGGRVVISDGAIKVYDTTGAIRIKIGNLSL